MSPLLATLRFLTIVPVPGNWGTAESDLARSLPYFPVVGLLLGLVCAGVAWGLSLVAPPMVAASAILVVLMAWSGCLHLDGLSDTADGFLSSRSRDRILEIMHDSHAGAMGMVAILIVLLTKFAALASLDRAAVWPAVLLTPLAGRSAMVVEMAVLPYARPTGLGAVFYRHRRWPAALWAVAVLASVGWGILGSRGLAACGGALVVTLVFAACAWRKIGGATGDTLGATCEIVEIVPALTLALWPLEASG